MAYALRGGDVRKLNRILRELVVRSESEACLICDNSGYVLAQDGAGQENSMIISALGAGVFTASRELAGILGEDQFSSVFHQGEEKSIFISSVNEKVLLVTIFSNEVSVGLVKLYARPATRTVDDVIRAAQERESQVEHPDQSFVLNLEEDQEVFETSE